MSRRRVFILRALVVSAALVACCNELRAVRAEERIVDRRNWIDVETSAEGLRSGTVVRDEDGTAWLQIEHTDVWPAQFVLAEFADPAIQGLRYGVRGMIRYRGVEGIGYLELWSEFAGGGRFFSRSRAHMGPLQHITGDSTPRLFLLPFDRQGGQAALERLELNLVLNGPGTVEIGNLELVDFGDAQLQSVLAAGAWWDDRQGGLIGGIAGSVLGIFGGLLGTLCGIGRGAWLCRMMAALMLIVGIASAAAGIVAVVQSQPYAVFYPLLLIGLMASIAGGVLLPLIGPIFRRHEMRRMQVMDAI